MAQHEEKDDLFLEPKPTLKECLEVFPGKRPKNIPLTKHLIKQGDGEPTNRSFFGDKRAEDVLKLRYQKLRNQTEVVPESWDIIVKEIEYSIQTKGLFSLTYSPIAEILVTGFGTGVIELRNADGQVTYTIKGPGTDAKSVITSMKFCPKDNYRILASSQGGEIFVSNLDQNYTHGSKCASFLKQENKTIYTFDIDSEGKNMITAGNSGAIDVYNYNTKIRETELKQSMRLYCVKFHPDMPNIFVSGGWEKAVKIWDLRCPNDPDSVKTIQGPFICGQSIDITNNEILTGSWIVENGLQLWDISSGKLIETIKPTNKSSTIDGEFFYSTKFFKNCSEMNYPVNDLVLVGGCGTEKVELISVREKLVVAQFPSYKSVLAVDNFGLKVAYGGIESVLRIGECLVKPN